LYHRNSEMPPHLPDARVGGSATMEVATQCHMTPPLTMLTCSIDNKIALTFQREVNGVTTFPAHTFWGGGGNQTQPPNDDTKQHTQHLVDCFFFPFSKTSRTVLFLCMAFRFGFSCISGKKFLSSGTFSGITEMR